MKKWSLIKSSMGFQWRSESSRTESGMLHGASKLILKDEILTQIDKSKGGDRILLQTADGYMLWEDKEFLLSQKQRDDERSQALKNIEKITP